MKKDNRLVLISIIILICLWQGISILVNRNIIFPSVTSILQKMYMIVMNNEFIYSIFSSVYRCIVSTLLAFGIAIIVGILSYKNKYIYNFCYPIFILIRSLPTMAFIVIALIWFSKDYAPILIGILIALPIFYDIVIHSLCNIDIRLLNMCKVYRVDVRKIISDIYIPSILVGVFSILNSTVTLVFKVIIAGELYAQPKFGIGASIQFEKMQLNTDSIIAWILIVTIISFLFDKWFRLLNSKYRYNMGEL